LCLIAMAVAGGGARAAGSFEGIFQYVHGDSPDFASPGQHAFMLTTSDGSTHDLAPLPGAFDVGPDDLQGETVRVQGYRDPKGTIHASDVSPTDQGFSPADESPITGSTPWAVLLCKYSNISAETNPLSYYTALMDNNFPRLDHYWRAQSYNAINLIGTQAHGWFTLPQTESYYTNPANSNSTNLTNLAQDCTNAANPTVNFAPMTGIIVMVNGAVTGGAGGWGGGRHLTLDGVTKVWPFAWMPSSGHWSGVVAHEMGHGYGLPHSSAQPYPSGGDYQSDWDVMSSGFWNVGATYAPYSSAGTGTIAYHKDKLGWVSATRKFTPASGSATTITLWPLGNAAPPGSQHLMAQIPIGATSRFYTVEARRKLPAPNYDGGVPADGVVIHEVDSTRSADALVVDLDGVYNQFPDPGEIWLPGETFVDSANGVSVEILTSNADGSFDVRIGLNVAAVIAQHTGTDTTVTEDGATDTYTVRLNSQPTANVTVTAVHSGGQVSLSGPLTFTSANWATPQSVTVTAVDDTTAETSPHTALVTHDATSPDPLYNGTGLAPLTVNILDNEPVASVSPATIAFGNVEVGTQSPSQTITVTNAGQGTLAIGAVAITGTNAGDFQKTSDTCSGSSRAAGQSCTIGVALTPSTTGLRSASVTIPHNAGGSSTVSLGGNGVQAAASLTPTSMSFGSATVGQQTGSQTATLTNTGTATLTLSTSFAGINPSDFLRVGGTCGSSLGAGGSCTILVAFKPTAPGSRSASLLVTSNAPGSPHAVALSGTGVAAPTLSLNRTTVAFGNVEQGFTSPPQSIIVTNTGGATLNIGTITISGAFASAFIKSSDTCSNAAVAPSTSCTIGVSFRPAALGGHNATLTIPSNAAGSPHTVALSGLGVDTIKPLSAFTTTPGSIKVAGLDRVEGGTTDAGSGVSRVMVYFTDLLGRTTQTLASLSCNAAKTSCTWTAPIALLLLPGIYSVNARATDVAGNVETPGPTISIMVM
ncbi:MAG TPA: choice-of-anchor D domain-containing protein, partial [Actinomycetota bacterium]|nr:choice-of-anchor D domain-containing protein [Actinomycetota bacterium]